MVGFRGSSQEKSPSEVFHFGERKAANDTMLPDPVGSGVLYDKNCSLGADRSDGRTWGE